jgi:hypothetical protein
MMLRPAILALALVAAATPARADCADDIASLTAHVNAMSRTSPNFGPARKQLAKAVADRQDELACDNDVARTWRAIRKPIPEDTADQVQKK